MLADVEDKDAWALDFERGAARLQAPVEQVEVS